MMDLNEVLCRAWIDCDPNRGGYEKGSGFHPDDVEEEYLYSVAMTPNREQITEKHDNPRAGQPRWTWFAPRAKALQEYLADHGYKIIPSDSR